MSPTTHRCPALVLLLGVLLAGPAGGAVVDATWTGGAGTWSTPSQWSGGVVPSNSGLDSFRVLLDGGKPTASAATLDISVAIATLAIDAGDQLVQADARSLVVVGGTVVNDGTWTLASGGSFTDLQFSAPLELSGTGALVLGNSPNNRIYATGNVALTHRPGHTIRGAGQLGVNLGGLVNEGTVIADQPTPLLIDPGPLGVTNTGVLRAAQAGTLLLTNGAFTNQGGTVEARDNARVQLVDFPTIDRGTLASLNDGRLEFVRATLNSVTTRGSVTQPDASVVTISGTLTNDATWTLTSAGSNTDVRFDGGATLAGSGTFVLGNLPTNRLYALDTVMTQAANHTIRGAGQLGVNVGGLANQGTVIADQPTPLFVDPGPLGVTNTGVMRAANVGTLVLASGSVTNQGGTIEARDSARVQLVDFPTIDGGILASFNDGHLEFVRATLKNVTTRGAVTQPDASFVTISGTLTNDATWTLNSAGSNTDVRFDGGATLGGSGTFVLSNQPNNRIYSLDTVMTHAASHTIRGAGQLGVNVGGLANQGTVIADQPTPLFVDPGPLGVTNTGVLRAAGAGTLVLTDGTVTNQGGTIEARDTARVQLVNFPTIDGGTLASLDNSRLEFVAARLNNVTTIGTVAQPDASLVIVTGTLTNNATWTLNSGGSYTDIRFDGGATLAGSGTLVLGNAPNNRVYTFDTVITHAAGHSIRGAGQLLANVGGMLNQGTILADLATALTIDPNGLGFTNSGSLRATGSGGLVIGDGPFVTSGIVEVGPGATLTRYGDFTQTAAGVMEIGLAEPAPAGGAGQVHITGTAALAGTLRLETADGFAPALGSTYEILTFASRAGDFAAYDGLTQPNGVQFAPSFTDTGLRLRVVHEAFTPTPTGTVTRTPTPAPTVTAPATRTPTSLPTGTPAAPATVTPTTSPTVTGMPTATRKSTASAPPTVTASPTPTQTPTSSLTPTPPPGATATPTATRTPIGCIGDCGGDGVVTVVELIRGVNIALETLPLDVCSAIDRNGDGRATIEELLQAVNNALGECTPPS